MPLNAKLVVVGGEVKTAEIKLRLPSTIGRGRGATIMLPHPLVSRQHCELFEESGKLMVRDLGSLNGTFVNNERIAGDASLPPGELLTVGAVTFRAVYEELESNAPPDGSGPQTKGVTETVRTGTASSNPRPKSGSAAPQMLEDDGDVQFDFDQPLVSQNDDEAAGDTAMPIATPKTDATSEDINVKPAAAKPAAKTPAKPAPSKPAEPAAGKGAPAKPAASAEPAKPADPAKPKGNDEQTVDISNKWNDDDEDVAAPKGDDEDDFGDFLKSLNK